tara:strand:- start:1534 stop:2070 length:537 start_codon:yes stop_codon:yes gene_type:complete
MIRDFIHIQDCFLSTQECDDVISFFQKLPMEYNDNGNYHGVFLEDDSSHLNDDKLSFLKGRFQTVLHDYAKNYPELNFLQPFNLTEIRFKHWKKNKHFDKWHSEHSYTTPLRVLNFMIYLSKHNCGTEFFNRGLVKSEKGRLVIFPSYFTHTHRGTPCPEGKDRYMFGGYFNFIKKID